MPRTNKFNRSYGLNNPLQELFPEPVVAQRAPTANDIGYRIGQTWVDQTSNQIYGLASITSGAAVWSILGPGASDVDTLTGDTGGAISPTGGNINLLGGDLLTVAGAGSTLTFNPTSAAYPLSKFVVAQDGSGGYSTIQAALDAANTERISSGRGQTVYVQPGTYTENLTFYEDIDLHGAIGQVDSEILVVVGTHTPPDSGQFSVYGIWFRGTTSCFSTNSAGTGIFNFFNVIVEITGVGFTWDMPNYAGNINIFDFLQTDTGTTGFLNNPSGSVDVVIINSAIGLTKTNATAVINGSVEWDNMLIAINMTYGGTGNININGGCLFLGTHTFTDSVTAQIVNTSFQTVADQAIVYNSSGDAIIGDVNIDSSNATPLGGTGAGTIEVSSLSFMDSDGVAGTLTIDGGREVTGALSLTGGAVTDFIGQATLVAGTVTVANTNIAATDRVLVTREGVGASTALGVLDVSITASTSFTITALQPGTPGSTETNDVSIVNYMIVRQL